ncbi:MAG: hypothetical protein GF418_17545 [Chitinivibrionales bacterium]|nr:hypothetical protein [Chitinivibrionales bacterium]MBD3397426.1 hypothetical protein [Chitinivibrionales bacterium]
MLRVVGALAVGLAMVSCEPAPQDPSLLSADSDVILLAQKVAYPSVPFADTLRGVPPSEVVEREVIEVPEGMTLADSIVTWVPDESDIGDITYIYECRYEDGLQTRFRRPVRIQRTGPATCPAYCKKSPVWQADKKALAPGYFVFTRIDMPGLFVSTFPNTCPCVRIPSTSSHRPNLPAISDCGEWIVYVDNSTRKPYVVRLDGTVQFEVPTTACDANLPTVAGFVRRSPRQCEIFYMASRRTLRAVACTFEEDSVLFGTDRLLADIGDNYLFNPDPMIGIAVVREEVFAEISPSIDGSARARTGFLTIPDDGTGVAGPEHIYRWIADSTRIYDGCGHTLSHDGVFAAANTGYMGEAQCIPAYHKGFFVSPFFHYDDEPVDLAHDFLASHATSINFCPKQYQNTVRKEADFWGWYFTNNNAYIVGRQLGEMNGRGVWMVDWQSNSWIRLTSAEDNIPALYTAAHFGAVDLVHSVVACSTWTVDTTADTSTSADNGPGFRVVAPNGGEVFAVGDTMRVRLTADQSARASVELQLEGGLICVPFPGVSQSVEPTVDSVLTWCIGDSVAAGEQSFSAISASCAIVVRDYGMPDTYFDRSDGFFSIVP